MLRRIHVPVVRSGEIPLEESQARHARDVLRLAPGSTVEVFDDAGAVATGELVIAGQLVSVRIDSVASTAAPEQQPTWMIAAAVPKGERADWMIEKLSELGTAEFIPLAADRSVVLPEGKNKRERWMRIATESAKQSRRAGVMRIAELTRVEDLLARLASAEQTAAWYCSTEERSRPLAAMAAAVPPPRNVVTLIGPEGGWTAEELSRFADARLIAVRLTSTVLRVETAAIAAAAVIGSFLASRRDRA